MILLNICRLTGLALLLHAGLAAAVDLPPGMPEGGCWADPMNNLRRVLTPSGFSGNRTGARASAACSAFPGGASAWCYTSSRFPSDARYYSALTSMSPINSENWFSLTNDIAVKVHPSINTILYAEMPFSSVIFESSGGPRGGGITPLATGFQGTSGYTELYLSAQYNRWGHFHTRGY